MTSSNLESIFQAATAPMEEIITEEVVVTEKACLDNLVYKLIEFASYLYQLNTQALMLSLNLEAPYFLSVNELLKEQQKQHLCDFETVGELVRSLDYLLPMCSKGLHNAYKGFKHVKTADATQDLTCYVKNLETAGFMAKDIINMAEEVDCPDCEYHMSCVLGHFFNSAWKLKSILRGS